MPFIEVSRLYKAYRVAGRTLPVLVGLDLTVERGEMLAIVGASGVGKSTLLHAIGGLDSFDAGTIRIGDVDLGRLSSDRVVAFRNRAVGFVFQFHHLLPEFSAFENAEMPLRIGGLKARERHERIGALLKRVGLADRLTHRPGMLSGGEQQRVAVARALAMHPELLLADEPTGDLDEHTADDLRDLIWEMHRERHLTSIIATHNMKLAQSCDRVLRLHEGVLEPA